MVRPTLSHRADVTRRGRMTLARPFATSLVMELAASLVAVVYEEQAYIFNS